MHLSCQPRKEQTVTLELEGVDLTLSTYPCQKSPGKKKYEDSFPSSQVSVIYPGNSYQFTKSLTSALQKADDPGFPGSYAALRRLGQSKRLSSSCWSTAT